MPRIPAAEGFGVLPGIRSGGARPVLSVEQAAQPGRQMQERGAQMMQIGAQIGDYAQQQQERINRARVQDATRQAERVALEYRQQMEQLQGAQAAEGIDGMPIGTYFSRKLERSTAEIERSLGSPAAREAFREQALALQSRFSERAMLYEAEQAEVFLTQNQDAEVGHQVNMLSVNAGGADEGLSRERLRAAYAAKFQTAGFAGDALEQEVRREMAKSHAIIIEQYLNDDQYIAAKAYFERYKDTDFSDIDAKKIEDGMAEQGRELEAIGEADLIWTETGGTYGDALARSRKIADPQRRQAVEKQLALLKTQDDAAKEAKDNSDYETGMSYVVTGRPIPGTLLAGASPLTIDKLQTEQQQRADRARAMAAMTAEEKAAAKQVSQFSYNVLKLQASNPEYATLGLAGLLADPELQSLYDNMVDEDRNKLIADIAGARQNVPIDKVTKSTKDILAVAGALLPANLKPSAVRGLGRGDIGERAITQTQNKSALALQTEGVLFRLVQEELTRTNGAPIDTTRGEQLFGLALAEAGGLTRQGLPKYAPSADIISGQAALDRQRAILDFRNENPDVWREATLQARRQDPNATDVVIFAKAKEIRTLMDTRLLMSGAQDITTRVGRIFMPATESED